MPIYIGGVDVEATTKEKLNKEIQERKAADGDLTTLKIENKEDLTKAINYLYDSKVSIEPLGIQIINFLYPVGSVYVSLDNNFDPNTAWQGTTWEKIESGRYLRATDVDDNVGGEVSESLPNVVSTVGRWTSLSNTTDGKAFKVTWSGSLSGYGGSGSYYHYQVQMDLSRSCSVYQNDAKVQPDSINVIMWKRTA